jgi:CheY-like chemotaxis protein
MTTETPTFEIVLAEDNPADVTLVREALKEHGLECVLHVIQDGEQAIAFVESLDRDPNKPRLDLLLLDMHLPKRDGDEILERLRCTERYARTPVVVMTSSDSPQDHENAQKHAALHYFKKPLSLGEFMELGAIVRAILGGDGNHRLTSAEEKYREGAG